jgi:ABC-type lipoprotein export system ATPase subunit
MGLIEVQNVSYTYRGKYQTVDALKNISCTFDSGKLHVISGPSGCGKTTLLSLLAGLDVPTEGDIALEGTSYMKMDRDMLRREQVAVIFQAFNLFPLLTAQENVMFPMRLSGRDTREAKKEAAELLSDLGIRKDQLKKLPGMFSGGEQQRIAIARALATGAKIILADEPTGNLDSENGQRIVDILKKLAAEENYCVVIVTHDSNIASQANVIYNLKDGKLIGKEGKE